MGCGIAASAAKESTKSMELKASWRMSVLKMSLFLMSENMVLHGLGSEQISQVFSAFLPAHTYALEDGFVREPFPLFREMELSINLFNCVPVLQLVLDNSLAKAHKPLEMIILTALESQLYFLAVALMSRDVVRKNLNIVRKVVNSAMASKAAQPVQTA